MQGGCRELDPHAWLGVFDFTGNKVKGGGGKGG